MSQVIKFLSQPNMVMCATSLACLSAFNKIDILEHPVIITCCSVLMGGLGGAFISDFTQGVTRPFIVGVLILIVIMNILNMIK